MKPVVFRIIMTICGICGVICGVAMTVHALVGFLPPVVAHPWIVASIGFLAGLGSFYLAVEKLMGVFHE